MARIWPEKIEVVVSVSPLVDKIRNHLSKPEPVVKMTARAWERMKGKVT
jgi:hypothetical protein